jgi:hypothetical protein
MKKILATGLAMILSIAAISATPHAVPLELHVVMKTINIEINMAKEIFTEV